MKQNAFDYRSKVIASSVLIGVLSLTAVLGWVLNGTAVAERQAAELLLQGLQPTAVTGLQVGQDIVLTKSGTWALTYQGKSFPASADRVDTYLKTLSSLTRERLVTQDGEGQPFGLDKGFKTLKLLGANGVTLYELQVGGTNELGDKAYVRFAGQKDIWQTDRGFARTLDLDFNTWADLSLFPGRKADDLTRIAFDSRIETSDKTVYAPFDLVRTNKEGKAQWQDRISQASKDPMASWAALVPTFHAGAFTSPAEPVPPGAPLGRLTATWSDGSTSVVVLGPADSQSRYRATEGTREFWINDWALSQILYK